MVIAQAKAGEQASAEAQRLLSRSEQRAGDRIDEPEAEAQPEPPATLHRRAIDVQHVAQRELERALAFVTGAQQQLLECCLEEGASGPQPPQPR
eukprot:COSAG01_NODE_4855_length_4680_cov_17.726697_4_plen_94_part_00